MSLDSKKTLRSGASKQFSDPLLVSAYDALNALGKDSDFWLTEIERLSPKIIIDLGCGTGLLTCELAKQGYNMIGIEPASKMLAIARKKPYAEKVTWIEGGYKKLANLSVDMVLMTSHVAQFFLDDKEWENMLAATYKVLNPGGYIIFDSRTPLFPPYQTWPTAEAPRRVQHAMIGPIDWYYKLLNIKDNRVQYQLHFHFLNSDEKIISTDELIFRSQKELTSSLQKAGLKVETIYGDWDSSLVSPTSAEMIFVAKRD